MSERGFDSERMPYFTPAEVAVLKDLARDFGSKRPADYPELEANIDAHFYTLAVDPMMIDNCNARFSESGDQVMTSVHIDSVRIEYNDQMEDLHGSEIEEAVSVEVKGILNPQVEPATIKEVRYVFMLDPRHPAIVQEISQDYEQFHITNGISADQLSDEELATHLALRYRDLTPHDVQLLQLLISYL